MRSGVLLLVAYHAAAAACGGSTPAPSTPSPAASPSAEAASNPNRPLDEGECRSLGQWLAEACRNRPNERSARVDGWCSDLVRGVENGSWVTGDCARHVRYMDSECLRSASNVHGMMDCDRSVDRSQ